MSTSCKLCPLQCGTDRTIQAGLCGADDKIRIVKYGLHPFEEPCISYKNGSGAIFFSGCSLRCVFCQNYEISHTESYGTVYTANDLAALFQKLEEMGAENINLVTAAHFVPQLLEAFRIYRPKIPVVYNTHSYETLAALKALDPYIDIWLPDLKFYAPNIAKRYTGRENYFEYASKAIEFMAQRECEFDGDKMVRGCIVRHLVLPLCVNDSIRLIQFFADLHSSAYLSVMGQYTPCGDIKDFPELNRRLTKREYRKVCDFVLELNLPNVFAQQLEAADSKFIPDFSEQSKTLF